MALERSLFPAKRFPGSSTARSGSLCRVLENVFEVRFSRAVERLEPVVADRNEATLLGVKAGAPLLAVDRTAYGDDLTPVEWARDLFRGDRTRVVVETSLSDHAALRALAASGPDPA